MPATSIRLAAGRPTYLIDFDVVDDDEPFGDELVELGMNASMRSGSSTINTMMGRSFDRTEDASGVHVVRRAEAFDAAHDRRAGEAGLLRAVHDLGGERLVVVAVLFADEDRQPAGVTLELHADSLLVSTSSVFASG